MISIGFDISFYSSFPKGCKFSEIKLNGFEGNKLVNFDTQETFGGAELLGICN